MSTTAAPMRPPFCPNERCVFHCGPATSWRWVRCGSFRTRSHPGRIQRFRCVHCRRYFSEQTFRATYWLRRPDLWLPIAHRLLGCSAFRQVAREFDVSPQTVLTHAARLGRHCLLFHERHRPRGELAEPLCLDSFVSFEWSQYHPTQFHVAVGQQSHYIHGFTESEVRRSGRLRPGQRRTRAALERRHGRPDPRAIEHDVSALLAIVTAGSQRLVLHSDEHQDYPRALARQRHLAAVEHRTVSSRAARTTRNPLFAVNLLDLLIRHSGANHKRETIAFSKRRQSAVERLWLLVVWRNHVKSFSERKRDATPAMRLGVSDQRRTLGGILGRRLFSGRIGLPERWARHYWRQLPTRAIARARTHTLRYAA